MLTQEKIRAEEMEQLHQRSLLDMKQQVRDCMTFGIYSELVLDSIRNQDYQRSNPSRSHLPQKLRCLWMFECPLMEICCTVFVVHLSFQ
jgi:hypothetical protein